MLLYPLDFIQLQTLSSKLEAIIIAAAKMLLVALPERIPRALLAHAEETQYSIEMVLEMAIAGFLDSEAITFADCHSEYF